MEYNDTDRLLEREIIAWLTLAGLIVCGVLRLLGLAV